MDKSKWSWKSVDVPEDGFEELSTRFLLELYEAALDSDPLNLPALMALGELYTRAGLYEKGLEVDRRLVQSRPEEPTFHYNLACSHSLLGNVEEAFESLGRAIQLGYDGLDQMEADPDLENLRRDLRWRQLLRRATEKKVG